MSARVGVDIGGTFTDLVLRLADGTLRVSKVSSTPEDPGLAVVRGLDALLRAAGVPPATVVEVVHGTTVASNTILQKKGARVGLLTTRGFRDVLEIGRVRTPDLFDLTWEKPEPLVERRHRLEVDERIAADGAIVRPLDREGLLAAAERLVAEGADVVAISFINSYVNPVHERLAECLLTARFPTLDVTASYRVLPEIKEYERTSTTVVNAYLLPVMRRYLADLAAGLRGIGVEAPLLVVASNGGVVGASAAAERPVFAVGSGPAAGVAGAARLGPRRRHPEPHRLRHGRHHRQGRARGGRARLAHHRVRVPRGPQHVEPLHQGGGLHAEGSRHRHRGGRARARGPSRTSTTAGSCGSARSRPARIPARRCYALGGARPTVTDANVALGFLNPAYLAGGELRIDAERARAAIRAHVAEPLGLSVEDAAHGIREVANANMARAIRSVTIERGRDPRDFTLVAFGGSGPVHAGDVARALDIRRVLVPVSPGVFTAVGMLASDVQHHFVRAAGGPLDGLAMDRANARLDEMAQEALATLAQEGYPPAQVRLDAQADLRYVGQSSELVIAIPGGRVAREGLPALREAFAREYTSTYGYASDEALELVNVRVVATGIRASRLDFRTVRVAAGAPAPPATRLVSFARRAPAVETPVLAREAITPAGLAGPLIVESYDSTVVVPPGAAVRRDAVDNLVITLGEDA